MRLAILGAGNWGTTFALLAHQAGHQVSLWEFDAEQANHVTTSRENARSLPGYEIPRDVVITNSLPNVLSDADAILLAVPAQSCRSVVQSCRPFLGSAIIVSLIKGIEQQSLNRISEIASNELTDLRTKQFAVLSGPTIAFEVAAGLPTSAVVASSSLETAEVIQKTFTTPNFRLYTSDDVTGVELAGALKNVIALAAGICDGMKLGFNTKGTLITRGLVELSRLGEALGGKRATFAGLSGMGDLVTTCTSPQSRNRTVGERIGRGDKLDDILASMVMVAEGVWTARAAQELARRCDVSVPITDAVCDVLFNKKSPRDAVSDLMVRTLKAEN
jgi:glycerol-3-phosphate dehydrogenase (NAD(P)+)